jgi:hypothetical protein
MTMLECRKGQCGEIWGILVYLFATSLAKFWTLDLSSLRGTESNLIIP